MQLLSLIAVGYITGIIWGLYLKVNIVPIFFLLVLGVVLAKKISYINKYKWYVVIFIITMCISYVRINFLEKKFDNLYKDLDKVEVVRNNWK